MKDGFADDAGKPNGDLPVGRMVVTLDERDGKTEMVITSQFPTLEAMEQVLAMGQEEGMVGDRPDRRDPGRLRFLPKSSTGSLAAPSERTRYVNSLIGGGAARWSGSRELISPRSNGPGVSTTA